ncbi:hypothetical protein OS493_008251 [Desmophyllum pertusum]|uniref:Uncharacterized protein n=1 Tax=Desmophyllum pertusum TaxID=174260 RepID=A0A9X0A3W8_9CNID|nr:hypothetical protein OS493_008251 [Desmophyllum pertusum]
MQIITSETTSCWTFGMDDKQKAPTRRLFDSGFGGSQRTQDGASQQPHNYSNRPRDESTQERLEFDLDSGKLVVSNAPEPSKRLIEKGTIGPPLPETLHRSSLSCTMSDKIFELPDEDTKAADDKHSTQKGASETTQRHLGTQRPPGQYDVVPSKEGIVVSYPEGATANPDRPVVGSMAAQGFFLRELK